MNTYGDYWLALLYFVLIAVVAHGFLHWITRRAERKATETEFEFDDAIVRFFKRAQWASITIGLFVGARSLELTETVDNYIKSTFVAGIILVVVIAFTTAIDYLTSRSIKKRRVEDLPVGTVHILDKVLKGTVWLMGIVFVLSNLGVKVWPIFSTLGITTILIGLAARTTAENMLSYTVIRGDFQLRIGDYVKIGNQAGNVTKITMSSTFLRALSGEEVVIPNRKVTAEVVKKYAGITGRWRKLQFPISFNTPAALLKNLEREITPLLEKYERLTVNWIYFKPPTPTHLLLECAFTLKDTEYSDVLRIESEIIIAVAELFEQKGIDFSTPTTVEMMKDVSEVESVLTQTSEKKEGGAA